MNPYNSVLLAPVFESLGRGNIMGRAHLESMLEEAPTDFPRLPIIVGDPFLKLEPQPQSADIEPDGDVDSDDLVLLTGPDNWGKTSPAYRRANIDRAGAVDECDLGILMSEIRP